VLDALKLQCANYKATSQSTDKLKNILKKILELEPEDYSAIRELSKINI